MLFDLDGVLVDSYRVWYHVLNAVARDLGYAEIPEEAFRGGWGQGIEADREAFFPRHTVEELARRFAAGFPAHLAHLEIAPGLPSLFETLRARGLRIAVVTNSQTEVARELVARAGVEPDALVCADQVPRAKPAPDVVLRACALLGVAPDRALVVGDSRFDRDAARAAGAPFAGLGIEGDLTVVGLGELPAHLGDPAP